MASPTGDSFEPSPLISAPELTEMLGTPGLVIVDVNVRVLPPAESPLSFADAEADFAREHVPTAVHADLLGQFSSESSAFAFTIPDTAVFERAAAGLGISNDSSIVIYSGSLPMWATRLWWLFRYFGHDDVRVLDGGLETWRRSGGATAAGPSPVPTPGDFTASPRESLVAGIDTVKRLVQEDGGTTCLLNALPSDIYSGESESPYGRRGHIPTSINVPWQGVLDKETGAFRSPQELRELFRQSGALEKDLIVVYCGGGIASTLDLLALHLAGRADARLYDGSITEWSDAGLPLISLA